MSDNSEIGAFMAGFVIGGLVGAASALIMAPQSGEDTRAQIMARSEELRKVGLEQFDDYRSKAGTAVMDARGRMQESADQVQDRARIVLDEGKGKVTEAIEKGKEQVSGNPDENANSKGSIDTEAAD